MIRYSVEPSKKGWVVIRRDEETGDRRPVLTKHSEYEAHLAAVSLRFKEATRMGPARIK